MAGKRKRQDASKRRRAKKRAEKDARKALYELWRREGRNTKSKRVKLRSLRSSKLKLRTLRHRLGPCGNIGCSKCNPIIENLTTPRLLHMKTIVFLLAAKR